MINITKKTPLKELAAFYHWDDQQALAQALMVADNNIIDFEKIKEWSAEEGMGDKFEYFYTEYKKDKP